MKRTALFKALQPARAISGTALGLSLVLLVHPPTLAQEATATSPKAALTITLARPSQGNLPLRLAANGNVAAWQEASIGSELSGLRLAEVRVNIGDVVQRNQVLAVFAADSVAADVAAARASLAEASANADAANADANRARALQDSGALSAQQIGQYETTQAAAQARVDSARANLAQQTLRLQHTEVRAPEGGIISARTAAVGAVVPLGNELFKLILNSRLEWRAEVTALELPHIHRGQHVSVQTANGKSVAGTVRMIAPTIDPQTRNALVYVDLPKQSPASDLRAGLFARGEFQLGTSTALTVPQQAVVARDGFQYVFSVGKDNKVSQRKVSVGRRAGALVEILQGLDANTSVAVEGAAFLNDGDTVRVAP